MGELNRSWALDVLRDYLDVSTKVPTGEQTQYGNPKLGFKVTKDELQKRVHVVKQILERVLPNSIDWRHRYSPESFRDLALSAVAELEREEELRTNLGDEAPSLQPSELHPWVWDGARPLWAGGFFNAAIWQALIRLNAEVQNKIGRRDVGEADAFAQAFSLEDPQPGKPRLRLGTDDGGKTWGNRQRGAIALAQAIYAGVRNPLDHEPLEEPSHQEAMETLATISLLARWTDNAELHLADGE